MWTRDSLESYFLLLHISEHGHSELIALQHTRLLQKTIQMDKIGQEYATFLCIDSQGYSVSLHVMQGSALHTWQWTCGTHLSFQRQWCTYALTKHSNNRPKTAQETLDSNTLKNGGHEYLREKVDPLQPLLQSQLGWGIIIGFLSPPGKQKSLSI